MKAPEIHQIQVTNEVLNLISELDEFKGRWSATQSLAPDRLASLKQVATIESVGSSTRIEGVKLTNSEIEALLRGVKTFSFKSRDEQEVAGYAEVMEIIFSSFSEIPLSINHMKQLHGILLKYSTKDERHRGDFKKFANSVEAFGPDGKSKGVVFKTATPFETPQLMSDLIEWTNHQIIEKMLHPLLILAIFVLVFLHIHPFQDGNGRLSRALTTLLLLKLGYSYVPYSSFERVIEENKNSYYLALRQGQAELEHKKVKSEGLTSWFVFFLNSMQKQKRTLEAKLKNEILIQPIPKLSFEILELIKNRGPSSISEITQITQANRNTIKLHLKKLVENGRLLREGSHRSIRYRIS